MIETFISEKPLTRFHQQATDTARIIHAASKSIESGTKVLLADLGL
jgi:hypothetical protein